jgi:hypothetical protein
MSVLVTISPRMYRETVAHTIRSRRPDVEVQTCPPEDLERKLALLQPDFLVCHDTVPEARERVPNRVEINYSDGLDATIVRDGWTTKVSDIGLERLLTVLDQIAILE